MLNEQECDTFAMVTGYKEVKNIWQDITTLVQNNGIL